MSESGYHVTDHALLRWLERLHDIDVDFMRAEMQREVDRSVLRYGETDSDAEAEFRFVLEADVVVTVLRPGDVLRAQKFIGGYAIPRVTSVAGAE